MKIGIVDLDTSHPQNWIPLIRELGHEVVGLIDHGGVHPSGYAASFARDLEIPKVFASTDEMAGQVDAAIIHSCNWDVHLERARPFLEGGKAVFIDKPMVGNRKDLTALLEYEKAGACLTGGSSFLYCRESEDYLSQPLEERGTPHTVFAGCSVDEFNYGSHAYSLLLSILGPGIQRVRHLGGSVQRQLQLKWEGGRTGFLSIGSQESWLPAYATIVTEKAVAQFITDTSLLYRALLVKVLPYLAGEVEDPPMKLADIAEVELAALAARTSWLNGDVEVELDEIPFDEQGYNGAGFEKEYRAARYS
ncbi:MAG: oxidoreductase [Verrucomicrobia bacterium]|nr:MAG: oxidoreductase [Verrucomicrobiota bacterium]